MDSSAFHMLRNASKMRDQKAKVKGRIGGRVELHKYTINGRLETESLEVIRNLDWPNFSHNQSGCVRTAQLPGSTSNTRHQGQEIIFQTIYHPPVYPGFPCA